MCSRNMNISGLFEHFQNNARLKLTPLSVPEGTTQSPQAVNITGIYSGLYGYLWGYLWVYEGTQDDRHRGDFASQDHFF
jgi:hypothetical protein